MIISSATVAVYADTILVGSFTLALQKHMSSIFFVKNSNLVVPFFHTGLFDVANAVILCILREK